MLFVSTIWLLALGGTPLFTILLLRIRDQILRNLGLAIKPAPRRGVQPIFLRRRAADPLQPIGLGFIGADEAAGADAGSCGRIFCPCSEGRGDKAAFERVAVGCETCHEIFVIAQSGAVQKLRSEEHTSE